MKLNFKFFYLLIFCEFFNFHTIICAFNASRSARRRIHNLEPWIEPCGISRAPSQNISTGNEITKGSHPWIAALIDNNGEYFCGGTLVSKQLVVTAAQCIYGKNLIERTPGDFKVLLGAHELDNEDGKGRRIYLVSDIHLDRSWNPQVLKSNGDIAVLKTNEEVKFGAYIQPVCLPKISASLAKLKFGEVVGFGNFDKSGKHLNILKKINTPIHSKDDCFDRFPLLINIAGPRSFCGGYANGTGVCSSGKGLTIVEDDVHYLRGISSTALYGTEYGCDVKSYSIFTDIRYYISFIKNLNF